MASILSRTHIDGSTTHRVRWREDNKSKSLSFVDIVSAESFRRNIDLHGHALELIDLADSGAAPMTLTEWLTAHIDTLAGVEEGTRVRYRAYLANDIAPTIGTLPLVAVTDTTVARWVNELKDKKNSGKTISNKHGFLAGALNHAVRSGKIVKNPCEHTRLPRSAV